MEFKPAQISDFEAIHDFYWDVIDDIHLNDGYNGCQWSIGRAPGEAKNMFYEDTGWTEFKLFDLNL